MTPADLAALHAVCFLSPRPWSAAEFVALTGRADTFLLTESQGFLLGRVVAGEAELLTLAVAPVARRQGTARRLLARFQAEAMARSAETAFLEVSAANAPARALYATAGWAEAGLRRGYYRRPEGGAEDALILTLDLPATTL